MQEVETLAILTGLEIDSAKSGIKPDLSEYIEHSKVTKSLFLKYKAIIDSDRFSKWYDDSKYMKLKKVESIITDYEESLKRVRQVRHTSTDKKRRNDIYRILFARGQETEYYVDELYMNWRLTEAISTKQKKRQRKRGGLLNDK